jgi:hypothetical protein
MDHPADASVMVQFAEAASQVESGKQIIGKQSLSEPDRSASGGALEANPRQINLDIGLLFEMCGGDVLVLGLGANAKPRRDLGRSCSLTNCPRCR